MGKGRFLKAARRSLGIFLCFLMLAGGTPVLAAEPDLNIPQDQSETGSPVMEESGEVKKEEEAAPEDTGAPEDMDAAEDTDAPEDMDAAEDTDEPKSEDEPEGQKEDTQISGTEIQTNGAEAQGESTQPEETEEETNAGAAAMAMNLRAPRGGSFYVSTSKNNGVAIDAAGSGYMDVFRLNKVVDGVDLSKGWDGYSFIERWIKNDPGNRYAYCFEIGKDSQSDIGYQSSGKWAPDAEYSALAYVMTNGAKVRGGTCDPAYSTGVSWVDYAVTQAAAHLVIDEFEGGAQRIGISPSELISGTMVYHAQEGELSATALAEDARNKAIKFYEEAVNYGKEVNNGYLDKISFDVKAVDHNMALQGDFYVSDEIQVLPIRSCPTGKDYQSVFDESSLSLSLKSTSSDGGAVFGAVIEKIGDKSFQVKIPKSSVDAGKNYTCTVSAKGNFKRQKVVNYKCTDEELQSMGFWEEITEPVSDDINLKLTVKESERVNFGVKKVWSGDSASDRPSSITVQLWRKIAGGTGTWINDKELNAGNNWQISLENGWRNLPKYDPDGNLYIYYAKERNVPPGYVETFTESSKDGDTLTVTNTREKVNFGVKKVWSGDNASDRPSSITVQLWRKIAGGTGTWLNDKELNAGNNWQISLENGWRDLPKYDADGNLYIYYAKERNVPPGYVETFTESSKDGDTLTVTNTREKVNFGVKKVWSGDNASDRPSSITVQLWRKIAGGTGTWLNDKELNAGNNWQISLENGWRDLPKYDADGNLYIYYAKERNVPPGYVETFTESSKDGDTLTVTNTREAKAQLIVRKVNPSGGALSGAVFVLTKSSLQGQVITGTVTGTGTTKYTELEDGTYYLKENKAPDGYKLPSGYVTFVVSDGKISKGSHDDYGSLGSFSGGAYTYTLKNEEIPKVAELIVKKTTPSGGALSGATFELRKDAQTGALVSGTTFGTGGIKYTNLSDGTYYLKESKSPDGYKLPSGYVTFVAADGKISKGSHDDYRSLGSFNSGTYTYTLENEEMKAGLTVYKVDPSGSALAGAIFELRKGSLDGLAIPGSDYGIGGVQYQDLTSGTYYLTEVKAPDGYVLLSGYVTFEVSAGKISKGSHDDYGSLGVFGGGTYATYGLTNEEIPKVAELIVKKTTPSGGALSGASFELRKGSQTGALVSGTASGTNGIRYTNLSDGTYYLKESDSPKGYKLPSGYVTFEVSAGKISKGSHDDYGSLGSFNSGTYTYTLKNEELKPTLTVYKEDPSGSALAGATFELRKGSLNGLVIPGSVYGIGGLKYQELTNGTYYLTEVESPDGYILPEGYVTFVVSAGKITKGDHDDYGSLGSYDGTSYIYSLKNEEIPKTAQLRIKKVTESGSALSGASFELRKGSQTGALVSGTASGPNGILYDNLSDGTYYLKESKSPDGYKLPSGYVTFVAADGKISKGNHDDYGSLGSFNSGTYTYTLKNEEIKPNLTVYKADVSGNALDGAVFELRKDSLSGTVIPGAVYGIGGMQYQDLTSGTYYLKEVKAPEGYILPPGYVTFEVSAGKISKGSHDDYGSLGVFSGGTYATYGLTNEKIPNVAELAVKKVTESGSTLSGASFELRKDSQTGSLISGTAGGEGEIKYTNLSDGTYYLKESKSPDGYKLPSGYVTFVAFEGRLTKGSHDDYGSLGSFSSFSDRTYIYTLKNEKEKEAWILPDTGGTGTHIFTFGGTAFFLAALLMMTYRRKKREPGK